jgi:hypothetical protein
MRGRGHLCRGAPRSWAGARAWAAVRTLPLINRSRELMVKAVALDTAHVGGWRRGPCSGAKRRGYSLQWHPKHAVQQPHP